MKKRYRFRWTYFMFAAVFVCLSLFQLYLVFSGRAQTFVWLCYVFSVCWLALAAREIYFYFADKKR